MAESRSIAKIRRLSRFGQLFCWMGVAAMAALPISLLIDPSKFGPLITNQVPEGLSINPPTMPGLFGAAVFFAMPFVIIVTAFWQSSRLFGLIHEGAFFTAQCQNVLVRVGLLSLASTFVSIGARTIGIYLLSLSNPVGSRYFTIGLSSNELCGCIAGILLLVFALLQREMAAIDEDNKSIL